MRRPGPKLFFEAKTHREEYASQLFSLKVAITLSAVVWVGLGYLFAQEVDRAHGIFSLELWIPILLMALVGGEMFVLFWVRAQWKNRAAMEIDPLTGMFNRFALDKILNREVQIAARYRYPLTLCFFDLDDFRAFNYSFGNAKGDERLKQFSSFMNRAVRTSDYFGRYQNDEFFIVLPHTDIAHAEKFVQRVLAQAQEQLDCSFSAGLTAYLAGESKTQALVRATMALEQAKKNVARKICSMTSDAGMKS